MLEDVTFCISACPLSVKLMMFVEQQMYTCGISWTGRKGWSRNFKNTRLKKLKRGECRKLQHEMVLLSMAWDLQFQSWSRCHSDQKNREGQRRKCQSM